MQDEGFLPEWHRFDPSQCAGSIGRWKRLKAEPVDLDTEAASEKRGGLFMNMCFREGEAIALF